MAGRSLRRDTVTAGFYLRLGVWIAVALSWIVMLPYVWSAFSTFPSAERLEQARMVPIPTLRSVLLLVARSAAELLVALALLWPWSPRAWTRRVCAAGVLFTVWFIVTMPLSLSAIAWVHRRWLAAVTAGLLLACIASFTLQVARAATRARTGRA